MAIRPVTTVSTRNERGSSRRRKKIIVANNRELGEYPTATSDDSYIHSTARGFRDNYNRLVGSVNWESKLYTSVETLYQDNQSRIQHLHDTACRYKVQYFGCGANDDIEKSTPLQILFNQNELVKELQDLQTQLSWSIINSPDTEIGRLNKIYTAAKRADPNGAETLQKRENFYKAWSNQWITSIQKIIDSLTTGVFENQFNELKQLLEDFQANIQTNGNGILIDNKGIKPGRILSELGHQWEEVATWILQGALLELTQNDHVQRSIIRRGKSEHQVIDMDLGTIKYEDEVPIDLRFQGGISAKFRNQENFSISAHINPANVFNGYFDKNEELKNIIGYLYNNWLSLASFTAEDDDSRKKLRTAFRKRRIDSIKLSGFTSQGNTSVNVPLLARLFFPLTQYVNLYMLNLSFYGNRNDVEIAPFDPAFLEGLDNLKKLPVFLLTKEHCHETADVFKYYNDLVYSGTLLINTPDLFVGNKQSQGVFVPSIKPKPTILRKLYREKRQKLKEQPTDSIYSTIGAMRPDENTDYFTKLLEDTKSSRKLNIRFKLLNSYRSTN